MTETQARLAISVLILLAVVAIIGGLMLTGFLITTDATNRQVLRECVRQNVQSVGQRIAIDDTKILNCLHDHDRMIVRRD